MASYDIDKDWQLGKTNRNLFDRQIKCDVTFSLTSLDGVTKKQIGGHTLILMSRSPVFDVMLSDRWSADGPSLEVIEIPDITYEVFLELLR